MTTIKKSDIIGQLYKPFHHRRPDVTQRWIVFPFRQNEFMRKCAPRSFRPSSTMSQSLMSLTLTWGVRPDQQQKWLQIPPDKITTKNSGRGARTDNTHFLRISFFFVLWRLCTSPTLEHVSLLMLFKKKTQSLLHFLKEELKTSQSTALFLWVSTKKIISYSVFRLEWVSLCSRLE